MLRHLKLYAAFWRNCLRQAVEFRANFIANLAANVGWMLSLVIFIDIIYRNTSSVGTWTKPEMLVLFGVFSVLRGISNMLFYSNLSQLPTFIRTGTMDFILTKPVSSQFYTSMRFITLDDLGQTVGGMFIVAYGWAFLPGHHVVSGNNMAAFTVMMLCALALLYSITLSMMTFSFWLIRLDNLMVLGDTVFGIARTPIDIFAKLGPAAVYFLSYIVPLAFIAALPVKALFGVGAVWSTVGQALVLAVAFMTVATAFWRYATRVYPSASS